MSNFWKSLITPFLILAPMEDVTDIAFRELVAKHLPKPDIFFTEFTSSDGLTSIGKGETIKKLRYTENQRPIVAQIWGTDPGKMYEAACLVRELKFDGIDINMGCPDRAVMKKGAGGAMCTNPALAKEIIKAVKDGAGKTAVSVKTRLGFDQNIAQDWIPFLLEQRLDALTVHGRIATQMSKGEVDWEEIGRAVSYRDKIAPDTFIVGN